MPLALIWNTSVLHIDMHFNKIKVSDGDSTACWCDSRHLPEPSGYTAV